MKKRRNEKMRPPPLIFPPPLGRSDSTGGSAEEAGSLTTNVINWITSCFTSSAKQRDATRKPRGRSQSPNGLRNSREGSEDSRRGSEHWKGIRGFFSRIGSCLAVWILGLFACSSRSSQSKKSSFTSPDAKHPSGLLSADDSGDDCGGALKSFYYDVEEGEYQPSSRLLFARSLPRLDTSDRSLEESAASANAYYSPIIVEASLMSGPTFSGSNGASGRGASSGHDDGYFVGHHGDKLCNGAFQLVAIMGRGTYSTVWLAADLKGVTANQLQSMVHRMSLNSSYNASTAVMAGAVHAFVVLKISRSLPSYVKACEEEFHTNKKLLLELQRRGYSLDRFVLFPSSFVEEREHGRHYIVQVGEVCGPSLLFLATQASPTASVLPGDKLWRLRCIASIVRQVLVGLHQLHSCHVVHTDIKPENVLFEVPAREVLEKMVQQDRLVMLASNRREILTRQNGWLEVQRRAAASSAVGGKSTFGVGYVDARDAARAVCSVKIADLGTSRTFSGASISPIAQGGPVPRTMTEPKPDQAPLSSMSWAPFALQTREYRAPEAIVQLNPLQMVTPSLDIWSVGCLAFELITGSYLFHPRYFVSQQQQGRHQSPATTGGNSGGKPPGPHHERCPSDLTDGSADVAKQPPAAPAPAGSSGMPEDERRVDVVHLRMIQELLHEVPPADIRRGGLHSRRYFARVPPLASDGSASSASSTHLVASLMQQQLNLNGDGADRVLAMMADFIVQTLTWSPSTRPTAHQLLDHSWLQGDFDDPTMPRIGSTVAS